MDDINEDQGITYLGSNLATRKKFVSCVDAVIDRLPQGY